MEASPKKETISVLIVEDDEDDFLLTSEMLEEIGHGRFVADWVRTYDEAVDRICGNHYDICLLDYRLGSHNGLELLRQTKEMRCQAPVILLTGQGDEEVDLEAMRAGAADFLVKGDIDAIDLDRSIRYAIQKDQMETERINLIRAREAREQAEAANQAKDDFLAMVSHELRNPLNSMLGWVSILRNKKNDNETYDRALDAIERSAKVQNKLVNDLLDISRIANGNLWIERQPVPLVPVVEAAIDEVYPAANDKNIVLDVKLDRSIGIVMGDPNRLNQAINNLLQNAIKFTPNGGSITITLSAAETGVSLSIADTGKGISKDFLPFVFERYRQANETAERSSGLGLGLAITRHIIDLHGGTLSVDSPGEGLGATFTITLPLISTREDRPAG